MFESDDNLVLTENKVRNVSLNLDNSAVTPSSKKAIIELSASNISSNYPMEYVSQNIGCNDYGFDGNLDVNQKLEGYRETARRAKFGEPANMWDNDLTTSYHTNTDFSPTSGTWGSRSPYGYDGCVPNTYIQVTLPSFVTSLNVDLTTQASGISGTGWVKSFGDTGMKIEVCDTDGNWETYGDFSNKGKGYGENVSIENIALSNSRLISAIRFKNNVATSDWTGRNVAFGIAELELEGYGVKEPAYVRHVKSVSVSPDSKTLDVTENVPLTATVLPENATDMSVTWSSSDNNVATVSNTGLVTANAGGTAIITATTVDGGKTATCSITVNAPVSPHKTYTIGAKHRDMQFNSPNYTKFPTHHFTQSGNLENYVEIIQGGVSYYTTSTSGWPTATIDGLSVVTAITGGGEDFVIPGNNTKGTMFTWVTDAGGLLPGKEIRANTEMSITNDSAKWEGNTYNVTSYLTTGSTYASIVYSRSGSSAKWKLIEVTTTKPE